MRINDIFQQNFLPFLFSAVFLPRKKRFHFYLSALRSFNFKFLLIASFLALVFPEILSSQNFVRVTTGAVASNVGNSSGASWVDYDADGDLDLFVSNRSVNLNYLYRNNDGGSFTRILSGALVTRFSFGNSWADYDNDGDLDCFLAGSPSQLLRNDSNGAFSTITTFSAFGVSVINGWACTWADYDEDGFVDLFVTHPNGFISGTPVANYFFRNKGDGSFARITDSPATQGLAPYTVATWSDFDLDGDLDLFIGSGPANGVTAPDFLFQNMFSEEGAARLKKMTTRPIATDRVDGQVWNWIDYDNDGDLDAFLTNWWGGRPSGMPNNLYRNDDGEYTKASSAPLTTDGGRSLGNVWGDFDNDGDLDVFVTNAARTQPNQFYRNNGDGTFTRPSSGVLATDADESWGATAGDYDDDGDLDLFVANVISNQGGRPNFLYRNDLENGNHWLKIKAVGTVSNASAIGARFRLLAQIGGAEVWQMREISAQNTFNGQNSLEVHFGLGDAETVDSLIIDWPSGLSEIRSAVAADQTLLVTEDATTSVDEPGLLTPGGFSLAQNYPNPFNPKTTIRYTLGGQALVSIAVFDLAGRTIRTLASNVQNDAGEHRLVWDGRSDSGGRVPSGVYVYRLRVSERKAGGEEFVLSKKMVFTK